MQLKQLILAILTVPMGLLCAQTVKHEFLIVDNGNKKQTTLIHINEFNPSENWTVPIEKGARDIQLIGTERVLVAQGSGAKEHDLKTGKVLRTITIKGKAASAKRLANGHTLLASGKAIVEVDTEGKTLRTIRFPASPAPFMRQITVSNNNTIFYPTQTPWGVAEIDMDGKLLWQAEIKGKGYTHTLLPNGNILNAEGKACRHVELDRNGKRVRIIGGKDNHPELDLAWFSSHQVLPNGNVVAANWQGHGFKGKSPHAIEFAPDNRVVWSYSSDKIKTATAALVVK